MKLGVCASIDQADIAYQAGFDYLECTVASLKPEQSDDVFQETLWKYRESPLPVEECNIFLPRDLKIVGESVDYERVHRYVDSALKRVHQIGAETVVFGSGGARRVPDGFSKERGNEQILRFLQISADYAEALGLMIVIEPLYRKASNTINNIPEAVQMAQKANRGCVQVLADFFHMREEDDPLQNIVNYTAFIRHIHISDNYEPPGKGSYPYTAFVDCINQANYTGRISIECIWNDFAKEAEESKRFVQRLFSR